jgi:hypothetical protein
VSQSRPLDPAPSNAEAYGPPARPSIPDQTQVHSPCLDPVCMVIARVLRSGEGLLCRVVMTLPRILSVISRVCSLEANPARNLKATGSDTRSHSSRCTERPICSGAPERQTVPGRVRRLRCRV